MSIPLVSGHLVRTTLAGSRTMIGHYTSLPRLVHMLCVGSFLNRAGSFVMVFMTLYVSEELQLGTVFATQCIGVFGLGSIVSSLLGGQLADHIGRRATLLAALFGGAGLLMVLSFVQSGWLFMLSIFVFALIIEMYRPAAFAMIGDVTPLAQRSHAFGLMYIAVNLGFAVAPPLGGVLATQSYQWLFWGDALTTAAFGAVVWWFVGETLTARRATGHAGSETPSVMPTLEEPSLKSDLAIHENSAPEPDPAEPDPAGLSPAALSANTSRVRSHGNLPAGVASESSRASSNPRAGHPASVRVVLQDQIFLLYCGCNLLTGMVFMQAFSTLPIDLLSRGYSELDYGAMICWNGILIVLLQMPMTHVLSRFNRVSMILTGELLLGLGFGLTAFAHSRALLMGTIVLWTLGEIIQAPFKQALVADLAPAELRARYMGVFSVSHALALAIGPPLGGQVLARWGASAVWGGCALLILVAMLLYGTIFRRLTSRSAALAGAETGH